MSRFHCKHIFHLLLALLVNALAGRAADMTRAGCGETKGCLFRPAGCDPQVDCTLGMIFFVSGPNKLTVQLTATSLVPPPPLQYIAIGFSHDSLMADDYVAECILSPQSTSFSEPEVFVSYNGEGKSNDRTYLNETERAILFDSVESSVQDMRISCSFVIQIVPQISSKNGRIWSLNHKYYIFGATGSAQPDELNAHDTSQGSHFYPIVSARAINPALIGSKLYELPAPFVEATPAPTTTPAADDADAQTAAVEEEEAATTAVVMNIVETTVVPVTVVSRSSGLFASWLLVAVAFLVSLRSI
ncbi:DOMON domain-containing protein [Aphelenchoides fujianensis]|nr:DOMON domain-containing protein [Aphelenchoides fujianensis]